MKFVSLLEDKKMDVARYIYAYIKDNAPNSVWDDDTVQCHSAVQFVKNDTKLKSFWWYKKIKFHQWNESKWKKISDVLTKDKKKFSNEHINNLIEDIADGSVNGHSFMSYNGYFIDPHLHFLGVRHAEIQKFCSYFVKL